MLEIFSNSHTVSKKLESFVHDPVPNKIYLSIKIDSMHNPVRDDHEMKSVEILEYSTCIMTNTIIQSDFVRISLSFLIFFTVPKQTEIMEYEFQLLLRNLTAAKTTSWIWTLEILSHNLHLRPEQQLPLRWILGECQFNNKRLLPNSLNLIPGEALPRRPRLLLPETELMIPGLQQKNLPGRLQT